MKMRKRIAALMAVVMIAALMPMSAFADSTNRVVRVATVAKDATITLAEAPELKIEMKDSLTTNQSFYLVLHGAEWASFTKENDDGDKVAGDLLVAIRKLSGNAINGVLLDDGDSLPNPTAAQVYTEDIKAVVFTQNGVTFEAYKDGDDMAIKALSGTLVKGEEFVFPLIAKVTDAEAFVEVAKYETEVSNSKILFAVSDAAKVKVVVGDAPNFYRSGNIAKITLEERYAGSIEKVADGQRWFTIELRDTDFTFGNVYGTIVGRRGYRGIEKDLDGGNTEISRDGTRLGIQIPAEFFVGNTNESGILEIEGIEIIAARDARDGDVVAVIDSKELFDKETIVVAKRGDYKTKLDVPKDWEYDVVAGTEKEVEFILSEEMKNSLVGTRPVTFTFDQGVKISGKEDGSTKNWGWSSSDDILWGNLSFDEAAYIKGIMKDIRDLEVELLDEADPDAKKVIEDKILAAEYRIYAYYFGISGNADSDSGFDKGIKVKGSDVDALDKDEWKTTQMKRVHVSKDRDSFTVDNFNLDPDKAGKYTFTTTLLIPAGVTGDITVEATGKGITEDKIKILEVEAPVEVDATKMDIKVGLKEIETTGKVVIKETAKERLAQGKDLVLRVDEQDSGLKIKSYKATVVEGDLVLADRKDTDRIIGVKRVSTEPSTIEITDIVMSTDRTVPEGKYDLVVGGNAISSITRREEFAKNDHWDIDPVAVVEDFINITTKNTEDIAGSANKAKVSFVVGSNEYLVNGKVETMDVAPYIKDSRTMVPVRYVAAALGVRGDQVIWDQVNQTATVLADKTIQVKLGSKMMVIDGVSVPMTAAAELTSDRTFIPVAEIARALNVPTVWDAGNATATFN